MNIACQMERVEEFRQWTRRPNVKANAEQRVVMSVGTTV